MCSRGRSRPPFAGKLRRRSLDSPSAAGAGRFAFRLLIDDITAFRDPTQIAGAARNSAEMRVADSARRRPDGEGIIGRWWSALPRREALAACGIGTVSGLAARQPPASAIVYCPTTRSRGTWRTCRRSSPNTRACSAPTIVDSPAGEIPASAAAAGHQRAFQRPSARSSAAPRGRPGRCGRTRRRRVEIDASASPCASRARSAPSIRAGETLEPGPLRGDDDADCRSRAARSTAKLTARSVASALQRRRHRAGCAPSACAQASRLTQIPIARSASGTPPSAVTSHVSCM